MIKEILYENKKDTFLAILSKVIFAIFVTLMSYSLTFLFDSNKNTQGTLIEPILAVFMVFIITIIMSFISDYIKSNYIRTTNISVKEKISEKVLEDSFELISMKNTGKSVSWFLNDSEQIERLVFGNILDLVYLITAVITSFVAIIVLHWSLALAATSLLIISFIVPQLLQKYIYEAQKKFSNANEIYTEETRDNIESLSTLLLSDNLDQFSKKTSISSSIRENIYRQFNITNAKVGSVMMSISLLSQIGLIVFAVYISSLGYTTSGSVLSIAALSGNLFNGVQGLLGSITSFGSAKALIDKYKREDVSEKKISIDYVRDIELKDIRISFDNRLIISDFNYKFSNKKKYALIGNSGSGKTTLIKTILGIHKVNQGLVTINDIPIDNIDLTSYFRNIAYIEQSVYFFNGSIRDNIVLGSEVSDEKLNDIIKKVNLDQLISKLPNGLDTVISSNAKEVSGGEKQRIAITRALVKEVDFIFVDEATSQLDKETAQRIEETILSIKDLGVIIISHHFDDDLINKFDQIINLNEI